MIRLVFALDFECAGIRSTVTPRLCVQPWVLGVTGGRSADVLRELLGSRRPSAIVSAGLSCALADGLAPGEILVGENFSAPPLLRAVRHVPGLRFAPIASAPGVLETEAAKRDLGRRTGALAADMETAFLHIVCVEKGIPMLSVRSISDAVDDDIPLPADALLDPATSAPRAERIVRHLLRHPACAFRFAKLVRQSLAARRSLALAIEEILPAILRKGETAL